VLRGEHRRVWSRATLLELGCGWERGRVLIPIRDRDGGLRGVLRYAPTHDRAPKMLAARGTRLGLVPHPATEPSKWIVLVEGPPDMISARSRGLPAIAIPGDDAWEAEWAQLLTGRRVSIVFDCDQAGRDAAVRIAADLKAPGVRGSVIDLATWRHDGYDLTDWLSSRPEMHGAELRRALGAPGTRARHSRPLSGRTGYQPMTSAHCAPPSAAPGAGSAACGAFPFRLAPARARIARMVPCETSAAAAISRCESPIPVRSASAIAPSAAPAVIAALAAPATRRCASCSAELRARQTLGSDMLKHVARTVKRRREADSEYEQAIGPLSPSGVNPGGAV
jgi:hypothetical protein